MLEPELQNIIETHKNLSDLLEDDYLIRDRIFTGEEFLEILGKYIDEDKYGKLEEEKDEIEEKLNGLTDKHKELRENVKKLAIKYNELRNKEYVNHNEIIKKEEKVISYDERIEAIKREIRGYKGEFVDKIKSILNK